MTFTDSTIFPFHHCKNIFSSDESEVNHDDVGPIQSALDNDNKDFVSCLPVTLPECRSYSTKEFQTLRLSNSFNVFHANVNGLEKKFDAIYDLLSNSNSSLDVIAFSETSLQSEDTHFKCNVSLDNYTEFSTPSITRKGGTTMYVKKSFNVTERIDLKIMDEHFESVWVEIRNQQGKNILCGCIYRHPHNANDIFDNFLDYMEKTLNKINLENKDIIMCGDFNCDLFKSISNKNISSFYDLLSCLHIFPSITLPTRSTDNSSTIVDNIFTNQIDKDIISGNILTDFSDHYSQFSSIRNLRADLKSINMYTRDYSKFSPEKFRHDIMQINFHNNFVDVNDQFADFYTKLENCVEQNAPLKKLKPKEILMKQNPWISNNLEKMIKLKNKFFKRKKGSHKMGM